MHKQGQQMGQDVSKTSARCLIIFASPVFWNLAKAVVPRCVDKQCGHPLGWALRSCDPASFCSQTNPYEWICLI